MTDPSPSPPGPLEAIGTYQLLSPLGEGGMGQVFLAEDADGRRVALKLVQPWLQSGAGLVRFRRERQVLAGLTHPGIARLIDGGTSDDGRPFIVLEYVDGRPIDRYCDEERLDVHARVALFLAVLEALAHAHGQLIVHGDLKPTNIFVDTTGRVRLLDFGVATLLDPEERAAVLLESGRAHYLTPAYSSPEQRRGEPLTAASDVYSLGAVLYELLTGRPPSREGETSRPTARPSTVVLTSLASTTKGGSRAALSAEDAGLLRATTPRRLARTLAGTLDEILLRCLALSPRERPADARELQELLHIWTAGRSLPGTPLLRRLRESVHRHPLRATAISSAPAIGLIAVLGLSRLHHQADVAWTSAREVRREVQREAQELERLIEATQVQEQEARSQEQEQREVLAALEEESSELEQRRERMQSTIGSLREFSVRLHRGVVSAMEAEGLDLVHSDVGLRLLEESTSQLESIALQDGDHATRLQLAHTYHSLLRLGWFEEDPAKLQQILERSDTITQQLVAEAPSPEAFVARAYALYWLGYAARRDGDRDLPVALYREARTFAERAPLPDSAVARVDVALALASAYRERHEIELASTALQAAQEVIEEIEPEKQPPHLLDNLAGVPLEIAKAAFLANRPEEAFAAQRSALELLERAAAATLPGSRTRLRFLTERATLATYHLERGQIPQALELLRADEPAWEELVAISSSRAAFLEERTYRARLAQAYAWSSDWPAAHTATQRRFDLASDLQVHHPSAENARDLAVSRLRLGQFELSMGRFIEATENLQAARTQLETLLEEDPDHVLARIALADAFEGLGDVYGMRGSQLSEPHNQLRVVERAVEALEASADQFDELQQRGQLSAVYVRTRTRVLSKLDFARNLIPQFEAAIAAREDRARRDDQGEHQTQGELDGGGR